jgi:hypothetical protein
MWYNKRKWSFANIGSLSRKTLTVLEKVMSAEDPLVIIQQNARVYLHSGETHSPHMYRGMVYQTESRLTICFKRSNVS